MTNYRESMSQTLEYMAMIRERKILERELTDTELKRREEIAKDLSDAEFKDRYGDKWMEVKMATATKMAKKESVERKKSDLTEAGGLSPSMIKKLRKAYSTINKVDPTSPAGKKMTQLLDKMNKEQLIALVKADIKFISLLAVNRLIGMGMNASQIRKLKEDQEEFSEMLDRWEEETELLEKEVWDKPMPEKEKEGKLTPAQKAKAKARAAKAGRKYPNMIDNMWASNEEVEIDEKKNSGTGYQLYHKDFSTAMQHAYAHAKRMYGITIDPKEIDNKVATGPSKPGSGKTNKYRLKGDRGAIQVQVYNKGGSKPYELNMYKEEVELDEASKLPPHLAKFFDKDGNLKKDAADRIAKGKQKLNIKDVTPKGYGPKEEVDLEEDIMPLIFGGGIIAGLLPVLYLSAKEIAGPSIGKLVDKLKKNKNYKMSDSEKSDVKGFVSKVKKDKPSLLQKAMKKIKEEADLEEGKMQDVWQKKNAKSLSVGSFELLRGKSGVHTIKRSGKVIGDFSYDSDADNFVANIKGERAQWVGNDIDSLFTHLQKTHKEAYEIGTDEYRKYLETLTPMEGARSDAMRDMRRGGEFDQKDDDDVRATKDDRKAANKNILQQLKKTLDTKGKADIEFLDKKKKKVPYDIAVKAIKKYMGMRRSGDKLKFQQKITKSYKDMLQALKENYEVPRTHKETILDRIDAKIQERKNG